MVGNKLGRMGIGIVPKGLRYSYHSFKPLKRGSLNGFATDMSGSLQQATSGRRSVKMSFIHACLYAPAAFRTAGASARDQEKRSLD
jgi:hypothetical protein